MERNVHPRITDTDKTSDRKHAGLARLVVDDRILCLDATGAET